MAVFRSVGVTVRSVMFPTNKPGRFYWLVYTVLFVHTCTLLRVLTDVATVTCLPTSGAKCLGLQSR